jgi:hypothetical protein
MGTINYITHLSAAFRHFKDNDRLNTQHISLYLSLFYVWNREHFQDPFPVNRREMKKLSHIGSDHTYAKCLKELHNCGYIIYHRSNSNFQPSVISMARFGEQGELKSSNDVIFDTHSTSVKNDTVSGIESDTAYGVENGTPPVLDMPPFIKQYINKDKLGRNGAALQDNPSKKINPNLEEVKSYFRLAGFPEHEADKFFFHYEAVGWLISGSPIRNWQAAAKKWNKNIKFFIQKQTIDGTPRPGRLHVNENKRYDIPL